MAEVVEPAVEERQQRVLVVGAHPDDPEFGCAGTVAKWAGEGKHVTYLLLTSGDKGSREHKTMPGVLAAQREEEQREAARALGVSDLVFLRYPDGLLENTMAIRRELAGWLRQLQPDVVLAIDPWRRYQLHPDHRAAGLMTLDAIIAAREWYVFPEQLLGEREPWRVKDVYLYWTDAADYWEDIGGAIDRRISALREHTSQVGERLEQVAERIREGARNTGKDHGFEYAEAFKHIKLG